MKTIFPLILLSFLTAFSEAQSSLNNGLISMYSFDGNANDNSGHGNHGTVKGALLTSDRFGKPGRAYAFNGLNYISIPSAPLTNPVFSWSLWARAKKIPGKGETMCIISIGDETKRHQGLSIQNAYASESFTGWGGGGASMGTRKTITLVTGVLPAEGVWYHLVVIKSETAFSLYENGRLVKTISYSAVRPYYGDPVSALIGIRSNLANGFSGSVDDVRFYNRLLSEKEINELYNLH